jgi:hypothetical protein
MPRLQTQLLIPRIALCGMMLATTPLVFAAAARTTGERMKERVLRMTEFFDTMLPGVLEQHNMTLHFRPKFSDLRDYEYMRFPFELRYGVTDRWEMQAGLVPFTPNIFNGGRQHRWGPGEMKLGTRYDIADALPFFDDTTLGFETRIPLGHPPWELNDHYTHLKPFVSAARELRSWPSTTLYFNVAYDRSVDLTHRDPPPPEVVRRNIVEVAPGLLFKPSQFGYFAEYRFRHIREDFGWHLAHEVQLGTIWDVPLARTAEWKLPGKWQLELAYKVSHEEGRETDHGISARVNWRTTLREVLEHAKVSRLW